MAALGYNFKNPEDVKAYLKNLYLEYRFACESEKDPKGCHLLGDYEETIQRDNEKACKIYKENCDERKWSKSCAKYAGYRANGKGCEVDLKEAYDYMNLSCELNEPDGCTRAGMMGILTNNFLEDRGEQINLALKSFYRACNEFDKENACFYLGNIFLAGFENHVEQDLPKAYKFTLKSCEAGNPYACANISQMYKRGDGIEKNENLAEAFKEKAKRIHNELTQYKKQVEFGLTK